MLVGCFFLFGAGQRGKGLIVCCLLVVWCRSVLFVLAERECLFVLVFVVYFLVQRRRGRGRDCLFCYLFVFLLFDAEHSDGDFVCVCFLFCTEQRGGWRVCLCPFCCKPDGETKCLLFAVCSANEGTLNYLCPIIDAPVLIPRAVQAIKRTHTFEKRDLFTCIERGQSKAGAVASGLPRLSRFVLSLTCEFGSRMPCPCGKYCSSVRPCVCMCCATVCVHGEAYV